MKKILFFTIGLMSLIAVSSCEDHFAYDEEKKFLPLAYEAKEDEEAGADWVSSTLSVLGIEGLVFDEIEKSDWKIITKSSYVVDAKEGLVINGSVFDVENDGGYLLTIPTNHDDDDGILVTLGNTRVTYTYMGKEMLLQPVDGLKLSVRMEETNRTEEPLFMQMGYIVFRLLVGYVPVKIHKIPFMVYDKEKVDSIGAEMPTIENESVPDNEATEVEN